MIATSEYELVTESAGLLDRSGRAPSSWCAAPRPRTSSRARSPTTSRRSPPGRAATPRSSTTRARCAPTCGAARRRTSSARHRGDRRRPCCATCSAPTRSAATSAGRTWRRALASSRWSGPGSRALDIRRHRRRSTPSPRASAASTCGPTLGIDVSSAQATARPRGRAVSEDAVECLRVESGRPRLGLDMDGDTIPQEAGINERAVDFTKGCYVGQETVARLYTRASRTATCAACC